MSGLGLYSYYRSSAAYRVRIALKLKGLSYDYLPVHLTKEGGEQHRAHYRDLNPQGLVPALRVDGIDQPHLLTQSLAIIEYLEEKYPSPNLLPFDLEERAYVRSLALMVSCDIHPLNNLRVLNYLKQELEVDEEARQQWYAHWIATGLQAVEQTINAHHPHSRFCLKTQPTMADLCLIPQLYNAKRFDCDLNPYPSLRRIYDNCMALEPFQQAAPEQQPDSETEE